MPVVSARLQLRQVVVLLVAACALAAGGIFWVRSHGPARPSDLVALLPTANASVFYIDVDAMRRSGILNLEAGSKAVEEPDDQQFVNETKFDYRQDLDAIAAAFKDGKVYFALRGRFQWKNLADYAVRQGGSCHRDFCIVAGSQPNRRISFYPLNRNVLAMAVGPDDFAAYQVAEQSVKLAIDPPKEPVWALIPAAALPGIDGLPAAAKAYVPALQGAERIVFSISVLRAGVLGAGPDPTNQLQLAVQVTCKDAAAASALLKQFESTTNTLRQVLSKEHRTPDPAVLTSILVAGTFHRGEQQVYGTWPLPQAFVNAIAGY